MAVDWSRHLVDPHIDEATLKRFFHNHTGHELEDSEYRRPEQPDVGVCRHNREIFGVDTVEVGPNTGSSPRWIGQAPEDRPEPITETINAINAINAFDPVTPNWSS